MSDPNEQYIKEQLDQMTNFTDPATQTHPLVTDGKIKIQGIVLQRILREGPPKYVIGWKANKVIYAVAYNATEIYGKCNKLARIKKCDPSEVAFTEINGKGLYDAMKQGELRIDRIVPDRIYESQCLPVGH